MPGVTSTSPVFGLIVTGTSLPSSSSAVILVSLSGLLTTTPVPWSLFVGSTGCLPLVSTEVSLFDGLVVSFIVTGTVSLSVLPSG